jgi:hypothetical protein
MLDIEQLYHERARRNDSNGAMEMRGTFKPALLTDYAYDYIFEPNDDGLSTFVIPVFDGCGVIDIVAVRDDVWGAVSRRGHYLGTLADPLRVYRSPADWIAGEIGVLPLRKDFYQQMPTATIA